MPELDDQQLLREFAENNSESAFATLVARHVNLVYSAALRFGGNSQHAEEISQAVFIILARKAGSLGKNVVLSGWLYQTARLTAANVMKSEIRRQRREQEAYMQSTLNEPDSGAGFQPAQIGPAESLTHCRDWRQIAPMLDDAMGRLGETDRNAVVLRFFENKTAREVAAALQLTEAAAHKRVNRALDKLRKFFSKRGVTLAAAAIADAVSANSVHAAPVGLAKTISVVALAKGAAASTSTLILVKGVLKIMAWTKAKTVVVSLACVILAVGTTTVTVKEIHGHLGHPWQRTNFKFPEIVQQTPPQVAIEATRFPDYPGRYAYETEGGRMAIGIGVKPNEIIQAAFGVAHVDRLILPTDLPTGKYDYIANLPSGSAEALQKAIETKFDLSARKISLETNVFLLRVRQHGAPGLKRSGPGVGSSHLDNGHLAVHDAPTEVLAAQLENSCFHIPVLDQTSLAGKYDFDLRWDPANLETLKQALQDQLGLELVPAKMPVEMLVVEKPK